MARTNNTTSSGKAWDEATKRAVWNAAAICEGGYSTEKWRRDIYGKAMRWDDFGNRGSHYGWEIDHINPVSNGGTDTLSNLQPLYWQTNKAKSDNFPWEGIESMV